MKRSIPTYLGFLLTGFILLGSGCRSSAIIEETSARTPKIEQKKPVNYAVQTDPYEGWGTIKPGGIVSFRIPPGCFGDSGVGNTAVVCPTETNPTPPPDMFISSDGIKVNVRRWEDLLWEDWDEVIASMDVLTPLDHDIQITIQK